jgi:DNA polymerase III alpha subunit
MELTNQPFYKTELVDRTLWYDGDSSYPPNQIIKTISKGGIVEWVDYTTDDICTYNKIATDDQQIGVKNNCNPLKFGWNIPKYYIELDVVNYIINKHAIMTSGMSESEEDERDQRLAEEIIKFQDLELIDVLRVVIYMVDRLTENNVVYGVGRGSSVSSYVLFVLKVHDVDSFKYQLDMNDFLHD